MDAKGQHEKFITNEEGTSILRYVLFCLQLSFSTFILKILISTFPILKKLLSFLIEFIFLHSFTIFSVTILDDHYLKVFIVQILIIILILCVQKAKGSKLSQLDNEPNKLNEEFNKIRSDKNLQKPINKENKPKNELLRSLFLNVLANTIVIILAVDFKVFPRRNAKIEHFGIGLMDGGAIFFLGLNAIISPEVRLLESLAKQKDKSSLIKFKILTKNLYSCSILLMIGLIRLYTIKKLNYQEHVSEYGVHMNFFVLLAIIKLLGMVIAFIFDRLVFDYPLFALLFIFLHEFLLKFGKLSDYLQRDGDRHSFLDKNKESFYTLIGYIGFYLSCYSFRVLTKVENDANELNNKSMNKTSLTNESSNLHIIKLKNSLFRFFIFFILFKLGDQFSEKISRRNMNMAFTCLNLSIISLLNSLEHLWIILFKRYYSASSPKLMIQNAYTNNGLITFLLSNILTGLINMNTNTMEVSDLNSIFLVFAYSFVVSISVIFLEQLNNFY